MYAYVCLLIHVYTAGVFHIDIILAILFIWILMRGEHINTCNIDAMGAARLRTCSLRPPPHAPAQLL